MSLTYRHLIMHLGSGFEFSKVTRLNFGSIFFDYRRPAMSAVDSFRVLQGCGTQLLDQNV